MSYFQRILINAPTSISLAVLSSAMAHVSSIWTAVFASFILSVLNMPARPILAILSLPSTLVTLRLSTFVINAAILKMASFFVGVKHLNFSSPDAVSFVAILVSFINAIVSEHNSRKQKKLC